MAVGVSESTLVLAAAVATVVKAFLRKENEVTDEFPLSEVAHRKFQCRKLDTLSGREKIHFVASNQLCYFINDNCKTATAQWQLLSSKISSQKFREELNRTSRPIGRHTM